jgi:hypothetical protein
MKPDYACASRTGPEVPVYGLRDETTAAAPDM